MNSTGRAADAGRGRGLAASVAASRVERWRHRDVSVWHDSLARLTEFSRPHAPSHRLMDRPHTHYTPCHRNNSPHTTTVTALFRDHPGEPVPEENFSTLWCKGRLTEVDRQTIRLGATPSGLTSANLHHPAIFFTGQMPFLPPNQQCQCW